MKRSKEMAKRKSSRRPIAKASMPKKSQPLFSLPEDLRQALKCYVSGLSVQERERLRYLVTKEMLRQLQIEDVPKNKVQISLFKPEHFLEAICFGQMRELPNQLAHRANSLISQWGLEQTARLILSAAIRQKYDEGIVATRKVVQNVVLSLQRIDQSLEQKMVPGERV